MVCFWKVWVESGISHELVAEVGVANLPAASGLPGRRWLCWSEADIPAGTPRPTEVG